MRPTQWAQNLDIVVAKKEAEFISLNPKEIIRNVRSDQDIVLVKQLLIDVLHQVHCT